MSEHEEDFAALFEASIKPRRFDRGQTIAGVVVGIGPKVAFVSVGGKSEAQIDIEELKDADGDVEVSIGDRLEAVVVSTSGGIVLSRKGVRDAATQRELEDAFRAGLAVEGKVERAVKGGYEVHASPASAHSARFPRSTSRAPRTRRCTKGRSTRSASSSTRMAGKTSSSRGASTSRKSCARRPRTCADRSSRCGAARSRRVRAGLRGLHRPGRRHPGPAPRLRNELVARQQPERDRRGRRRAHRQGAAGG